MGAALVVWIPRAIPVVLSNPGDYLAVLERILGYWKEAPVPVHP